MRCLREDGGVDSVSFGVDSCAQECIGYVERVEPVSSARSDADRGTAVAAGKARPVTLRIDCGHLVTQRDGSQGECAGGVGLAGADLAGDEDVRVRDQPVAIQLERGERKRRPCAEVRTQERAIVGQGCLGEKGVGD